MSLLSIVIPLFNQEKYIKQCVESIQSQTLTDIKILIVDDGSTDGSGAISDDLAKTDNRISVIHQENRGLAGARMTGLKNVETKYVTFVDADDFILVDSYERALEYMKNDIDMVFFEISRYFDAYRIKQERHIFEEGFYDRGRIENVVYKRLIWDFDNQTPGMECSQCVRITKKNLLLERYNDLSVSVYYGEDMAITYPLYKYIKTMQVVPYSYYMHRQPETESCQSYIAADGYFKEVFELYQYLKSQFADSFSNFDLLKQIDYLYMYMVLLKKRKYKDEGTQPIYFYPFDKTIPGKRVVLYGAGNVGRSYYEQLMKLDYCNELLWVDRDAIYLKDERIKPIDQIWNFNYDYIVIAINDENIQKNIKEFLVDSGIKQSAIVC